MPVSMCEKHREWAQDEPMSLGVKTRITFGRRRTQGWEMKELGEVGWMRPARGKSKLRNRRYDHAMMT